MGVLRAVLAACLVASPALGQARPSRAELRRAEAAVRARFAAAGRSVLDVTPRVERPWGLFFWVRWTEPSASRIQGGLVAVRGAEILDTRGDATVARVLELDRMLVRRRWRAADLLYLLRDLGTLPAFPRDVIDERSGVRLLRPRLTYGRGCAQLVLYAHAPGPPEDAGRDRWDVHRAILTIDARYRLSWSALEHVVVYGPSRARSHPGARLPPLVCP